jgi:O-antigen/teichoic acid export membrane protein
MILGSSVVQLSVKAAITIAVFAIGMKLAGYILATAIATFVGVLWMGYGLRRKDTGGPKDEIESRTSARPELRRYYAISYTSALLGAATAYLDRLLLGYFVGTGAVGVLLVVSQLQQFPSMFNQMLLIVGAPMFAAAHVRDDPSEREHIYLLMTDWVMKAAMPLILFLLLFAKPVLLLFGPQFAASGAGVLWIFVLGQTINLACGPIGNIAVMSGLEGEAMRWGALNTALRAGLLVILTPALGLLGVAIAAAITTIVLNVALMLLVRRRLGMRWWHRRFAGWFLPSFAAAIPGIGVIYLGLATNAVHLAAILALMYAAFGTVLALQGVNADEKELLRHLWNYIFAPRPEA